MPTPTRAKLLPGREGDAVIKAPSISAKLIILKGLTYERAKEYTSLFCDIHFLEELISKAQVIGKFRELPHCIVIYNADAIAQEVANELGIEAELVDVHEVTGGTHFAPRTPGAKYPEDFEPEPFVEDPEIAEYVEEIERSFEYSTEEETAVEGPVVEDVEDHGCYFKYKLVPVVEIEVEGEEEAYEIPVKVEKKVEVIKAAELTLRIAKLREKGRYEYPYVTFTVKAAELAAYAGKTVRVVLQLSGVTITRYVTVKTVRELGRYVYGYVQLMVRLPREMLQYVGKTVKAKVTVLPA